MYIGWGGERGRGRGRGRGRESQRGRGGRGRGGQDYQATRGGRGRGRRGGSAFSSLRMTQLPSNPSELQFIHRVLKTCPNNRLAETIGHLESSWTSCWLGAANLPSDALKLLMEALSRLPFSASISPPPLTACTGAVSALLSQSSQQGGFGGDGALDGNDAALENIELVERVVKRLMKFTWDLKREDVKEALEDMIAEADSSLNIRLKSHRPVRTRLGTLVSELEKPWIIKVESRDTSTVVAVPTQVDWRHPTLAWLADFRNFQPLLLPRLQLPRTRGGRVYETSDEYFETITKLWIGMTFIEGNNALLPHCTAKIGEKVCDQPLWPIQVKEASHSCRNQQCHRFATFLCAHRMHSKGYCGVCAGELQQRLRGPPSKHASTHVYDGTISSVKYDGTIAVEQVASRRPPLTPIHWRTTKRLSSPNLVGVVLLANREASLRSTDEIYWGQIIFQGKSFEEFKARERGCLTLRLLEYHDEPGNPLMERNPTAGNAVAIIDCQTFVPEFIPVLKALEMQRQMPVPFENGALLNLSADSLPFISEQESSAQHYGTNSSDGEEGEVGGVPGMARWEAESRPGSTQSLISEVVRLSYLDPIVDIRRDAGLRSRLESSLLHLVNRATLDPGQLTSFAEALIHPVHCTQGPPGTGKSYLGVVIVRALLVVRDLWKQKNREVGDPPLLVLSYKNHAIDEFLLDLLRSDSTLGHQSTCYRSRYNQRGGFKKVVRIGGGCSEPELEQYSERNVAAWDPSVKVVAKDIEECQRLREEWNALRDCFSSIFEAQTAVAATRTASSSEEVQQQGKLVHKGVLAVSKVVAVISSAINSLGINAEEKELLPKEAPAVLEFVATDMYATSSGSDDSDLDSDLEADIFVEAFRDILESNVMLRNVDIAALHAGIKHYDPQIDPHEVLYQWMTGFYPQPACSYDPEPCSSICIDGSDFCQDHSCKFVLEGEQFCNGGVHRKRLYCERHLCCSEKCKDCRVDESQLFCAEHACFVCLEKNTQAGEATDEPPRNACEKHPLCWGMNGTCTELAEIDASYCKDHAEHLYCKWVSRQGVPCSDIATTAQFCWKHHEATQTLSTQTADKSHGKCMAKTKKGRPCRGAALTGSNFCRDHVGSSSQRYVSPILDHSIADVKVDATRPVEVKEDAPAIEDAHKETKDLEPPDESLAVDAQDGEAGNEVADSDKESDVDVDALSSCSFEEVNVDEGKYDNLDEVEESDHLQHLREVYEVEDGGEEESESSTEEDIPDEELQWTASEQTLVPLHAWNWDMTLEERWSAIFSVLGQWNDANTHVQKEFAKLMELLKRQHHREMVRANARVYEGKSVIGGTITGCVARLEAIRTTNPFAILVEEASEVMEPLLVACFSSSTCKLEMIGDHMQLQPSVMGKIDFERVNKINISMFERLICAPHGHEVPSSVLSIQRRMRKNICDLTRGFYKDITAIQDHEVCATKLIGDAAKAPKGKLLRACEGRGREVPGVLPHVFFWTHSGAQQRAAVGLSRVNPLEAHMCCKLVEYLVHCGVPPKSVAVLTPYKGQLMLMRKMLITTYGLGTTTGGQDPRPVPACILSTVDRFQGDEADVVIISLVIDGKSRTPFVKLQNRMIVLLSRARLGMYIVGNKDYFGETTHWQKTLGLLEQGAEPDNAVAFDCTPHEGTRIGPKLPICCPEHRTSTVHAENDEDLALGFCTVVCSAQLPCSHECGLKCHWPDVDKHQEKCSVEVQSPCSQHPRLLKCSVVTAATRIRSIDEALSSFACDFHVTASLPCGHSQKMECHLHKDVLAGRASWPVCVEEAVAPFVYPECKHFLNCSCDEFQRYSRGQAPDCDERVEHTPACGHEVLLRCHEAQAYTNGERTFVCKKTVSIALPRCGHTTSVACQVAQMLEQWSGTPCLALGLVKEGESYGPKDYSCQQLVTFERRCGHREKMKCEKAFELAKGSPRCMESVVITNPECGHECETTCYDVSKIADKVAQEPPMFGTSANIQPLQVVVEGDARNYRKLGLRIQCTAEVVYERTCGHKLKMTCSDARHFIGACEEVVTLEMPSCGHSIRLPCHLSSQLTSWQPWQGQQLTPVQQRSIQLLHEGNVVEDRLPMPEPLPSALKLKVKECNAPVRFRRANTCGHDLETKCSTAFQFIAGKQVMSPCSVRVSKMLDCGHEAATECSKPLTSVTCSQTSEKPCWNSAVCGNMVEVPCNVAPNEVQCGKESKWVCSAGHSFQLRLCNRGYPTDCPECSTSRLDAAIAKTKAALADVAHWSTDRARVLPDLDGVTNIVMNARSKRDFLVRKQKLLGRFKEIVDSDSQWSKTLFEPKMLDVFVVANRKLPLAKMESFEMRDFGSAKTLNGIEAYEATQENLARVAKAGTISIVFGRLYTARHLVNPGNLPNGKGKKRTIGIQKWVAHQVGQGHDALYRDANAGKKGGSWIVWHPHTMFPLHYVTLTDANREMIMKCLPVEAAPKKATRSIRLEKPFVDEKRSKQQQPTGRAPPADVMTNLQALLESVSPLYGKLEVCHPWDGKKLSSGGGVDIPKSVEKSLLSKLNFVPAEALGVSVKTSKTPFGGIKYLRTLQGQGKLKVDGNLFLAMESLAVRKETSEARTALEAYVKTVGGEEGDYAHPLVILAISQLSARASKTKLSDIERRLVIAFATLYPEAAELWLTGAQKQALEVVGGLSSIPGSNATDVAATSVEDKWEELKSSYGCQSRAMEELMKLVGLRKVKQAAVNLFKSARALQQMTVDQRKKNSMSFNYCFMGNPGTGKTTVARLFAQIMQDSRVRPKSTFVECSAQELKDNGADKFREEVKKAMGGVLFIDEAYELDPMGDFKGKPIVAELLKVSEDSRDSLSIIIAGYEDDIQKKLYAYNDGLSSRFSEVMFEDFDAQDLEVVWDGLALDRGWEYEKAIATVACRRLAKAAGRKGFGNARAVRKLFEQAAQAAMGREDFDGTLKFQTVDLLGERPSTNPKLQQVLDEIEEKTGWGKIKAEMKKLVCISDENYEREMKGQETVPLCLNRLFLGNPGTGKTTCAAYYGRVLKALNFLSNGEVVKKTAGDFVGSHVGESQVKTGQLLDMAKGKVLVIDEAYNLNDNLYGKQVLDVLVEKVQGTESDDLAVLLIGYDHQMLEMLRTQNPGLMRRFPPQYAFHFEDYTEHELLEILEWNCAKRSVVCPLEVAEALLKQLALQKTQPNFGNAGAVEQLLKSALGKAVSRPMVDGKTILSLEDVGGVSGDGDSTKVKDPLELLDKLYRMDEIKRQLSRLRNDMVVAEREGSERPEVGHFVFRGSPGTGKTTVARVMAEILHGMGVLATKTLVESSGLELTGEFVGQTKKKVTEKLGQAKGGLLFIDEAYELGKGHYGEEAMTTLVAAMTDPSYLGMVIIIAGYPKDMNQMLDRNAGLKSRFTRFIDFPDWEVEDMLEFLSAKADAENLPLEEGAVKSLEHTFAELKTLDGFGNGRDAIRVWKEMLQCRSQRVVDEPEVERCITEHDAGMAGEAILAARRPPDGPLLSKASALNAESLRVQESPPRAEPAFAFDHRRNQQIHEEEQTVEKKTEDQVANEGEEKKPSHAKEQRDAGVSDEDWEELERAKAEHAVHLEELRRAKAEHEERLEAMRRALEQATLEEERRRLQAKMDEERRRAQAKVDEERRREAALQEKIRRICPCPVGFNWYKCGGGWRCGGGSHFVSDAQLNSQFTC